MLSEERRSHLAHIITNGLWQEDLVDYSNDDLALRAAKKGVQKFVDEFQEIDVKVHQTLKSLKRNVVEGSNEWDVLYAKYFEEELQRRGV